MNYGEQSVAAREQHGGLLETSSKVSMSNQDELATYYSPGVAEPCKVIAADPAKAKELTVQKNTVAVISDGSAVLGLGNIGAAAALPVMEGKCLLLKNFADVDGVPIVLNTQDTDAIVEAVVAMAPSFGGINLEDITAPRCFEIERRVAERTNIPIFHDDQHGTAMVVLAALINALKVVNKEKSTINVVIAGAGAAGIATGKLLRAYGIENIKMVDSRGIITCDRDQLNLEKQLFCTQEAGDLTTALNGADVFIGVSKANTLTPEMIKAMNHQPVIFGLANPNPEIKPELAHEAGAAVVATGRSDYPNQINNVLVFPGIFRGLLDAGATTVTDQMKIKASEALAGMVSSPTADKVIPHPFDEGVAETMAEAVKSSL